MERLSLFSVFKEVRERKEKLRPTVSACRFMLAGEGLLRQLTICLWNSLLQ